jgi:hypothetical protein
MPVFPFPFLKALPRPRRSSRKLCEPPLPLCRGQTLGAERAASHPVPSYTQRHKPLIRDSTVACMQHPRPIKRQGVLALPPKKRTSNCNMHRVDRSALIRSGHMHGTAPYTSDTPSSGPSDRDLDYYIIICSIHAYAEGRHTHRHGELSRLFYSRDTL